MKPGERDAAIAAGVERAHSFRSPGHWDASTPDLVAGWQSADAKVGAADSGELVFLAALGREQCAMVLRARGVRGAWDA